MTTAHEIHNILTSTPHETFDETMAIFDQFLDEFDKILTLIKEGHPSICFIAFRDGSAFRIMRTDTIALRGYADKMDGMQEFMELLSQVNYTFADVMEQNPHIQAWSDKHRSGTQTH